MTEPRYTEEQFAEILRRATEMQARLPARTGPAEADASGAPEGLSLSEIRTIAGEVGIDPELVTRAAALVSQDSSVTSDRPDRWVLTSSTPGTLGDEDKIRIVRAIRDADASHGDADMAGAGMEWRSGSSDVTKLLVSVEPLDGRNELRVSVDANATGVLSHFFPMLGFGLVGVGTAASMEPTLAVGLGIVAAAGATGFAAGRLIWSRLRRKAMERSRRIFAAATAALPAPPRPPDD